MTLASRALDRPMPKPTAQVEPCVDAWGPDLAMPFILTFGGGELVIPKNPGRPTPYAVLVGPDGARAICAMAHRMPKRVPLAKAWLAAMLDWQGHSATAIARQLRISDISVRRMLKARTGSANNPA